jgi:putative peptide zinc metalloprotease protein
MLVGAAGMMVELALASLAVFLWINLEPGMVRAAAYNVIFIAGVSTILFNANPLLRYDGYYMLADFLELPNLRAQSHAYLLYLCERYLFGREDAATEPAAPMERFWLTVYPIAAFVCRLLVLGAIILFLAGKFFFIGVLLALAGLACWILVPLIKAVAYLATSRAIHSVRRRAIAAAASVALALAIAALVLPLPLRTRAEGVIWLPEQARLRAAGDGFVERVVARPGSRVRPDDVLVICHDPHLSARVKVLEARLEELETRYMAQLLLDIRQAQIAKDEVVHVQQQLARARERLGDLVIRSRTEGVLEIPDAANLPGRFVRQGAILGYVLDVKSLTVRVVVPEAEVELVRHQTRQIEVRPIDRPYETFRTVVRREVPGASVKLPTIALGSQGGGKMAVDPLDKEGVTTVEKTFQLDLELPANAGINAFGGRVYVRFHHGWEPIAKRWQRQLRQLFLSHFHA